jgi:hypothetical protein
MSYYRALGQASFGYLAYRGAQPHVGGVREEFDLRKFTRKDAAQDAPPDLATWHRTVANLSSLTALLKQRILTQKLPAHNTTRKCHNCGLVEAWNSAAEVQPRTFWSFFARATISKKSLVLASQNAAT